MNHSLSNSDGTASQPPHVGRGHRPSSERWGPYGVWRRGTLVLGLALWAVIVALPAGCLVFSAVARPHPAGGWHFTERQILLLGKTAALAGISTCLSVALALGVLTAIARRAGKTFPLWMGLPLLLPPYVYAFGWSGLWGPRLTALLGQASGWVLAAGVWSAWAWPIPAMILFSGWQRIGMAAYQAALLETGHAVAFRRVALEVLAGHLSTSCVLLWVLFMIEYSVPHACSIQVYSTELLAWAQVSRGAMDVVWPSMPAVVLVVAVAAYGWFRWGGWGRDDDQQDPPPPYAGKGYWPGSIVTAAIVLLTTVVPLLALVVKADGWQGFVRFWDVHGDDLIDSFILAAASGVIAVWMGVVLDSGVRRRWVRGLIVASTFLWGLMPPGMVGQAMVLTYQRLPLVYDHFPIMVLTEISRWGWIGFLAALLVRRSTPRVLVEQARTDGADEGTAGRAVGWWMHWPVVAFGAALIAAMSLAEVAAMSIVRPPGVGWIALTLMEKFHRLEDQMVATISIILAAAPLPALVLAMAWRRRAWVRNAGR